MNVPHEKKNQNIFQLYLFNEQLIAVMDYINSNLTFVVLICVPISSQIFPVFWDFWIVVEVFPDMICSSFCSEYILH